jgi:lysophospholipase L1-like esterase
MLERELQRLGRPKVEVLNAGAPGYNTSAELAFLETYGLALEPGSLIVGVSLNDIGNTPFIGYSGVLTNDRKQRPPDTWLARHSEFYLLLDWVVRYLRGKHAFQREAPDTGEPKRGIPRGTDRQVAARQRQLYADLSLPGWQNVRAAAVGLREIARERGIDLLFVLFPDRYEIARATRSRPPRRAWLELCEELRLRCLDLLPAFGAAISPKSLYLDPQHPNGAGMEVAASAVAQRLIQGGG